MKKSNTTATKSKKTKKVSHAKTKQDNKPSLEDLLAVADRAHTNVVCNYLVLGETLVKIIDLYGSHGREMFRTRLGITPNAVRNLEYVGRKKLLPQFAMCSDRFVKGLVDMTDSLTWQYRLIGASKNGLIRIRLNGNIVDAKFEDLKKNTVVDGVLSIISEADKDLTPDEIADKLTNLSKEVRSKFNHKTRRLFEIVPREGHKVVRFFQAKAYTADDLRKIIEKLEEA